MSNYDKTKMALFHLMCTWFESGWTNPFIRNIYANGVPVTVDDPENGTTLTCVYRATILTDTFLDAARRLHADIKCAEYTKIGDYW